MMSRHSQDQFYQSLSIKAGISPELVEILKFSREQSASVGKSEISLAWGEAWMMVNAVKRLKPRKILEAGTLTGFSALFLTEALEKGGEVWTVEKDPIHIQKSREVFCKWGNEVQVENNHWTYQKDFKSIHLIFDDGLTAFRRLSPTWDAIFIDANKSATMEYVTLATHLLKAGGALIVDNSFGRGALWDKSVNEKSHKVLNQVSDFLSDSEKFDSCLWPTSDGMWWAVKK